MILSPGRRVDIVSYLRLECNKRNGSLITVDTSPYAPALYYGDRWYVINKDFFDLDDYISRVISLCKKEKVSAILTLIDPELLLLAAHRQQFLDASIIPILSPDEGLEASVDKYLFYETYHEILPLVKSYVSKESLQQAFDSHEVSFPFFAKFRTGSASIGIQKIESRRSLQAIDEKNNYVYQPFIDGKELGVDAYIDLISGKMVSVFMKEKIAMRAGETDKAVSIYDEKVFELIKKIEDTSAYRGPIDIDVFIARNGTIYINEINPRFGGGHPHAYNCGVNFMELILNNIEGMENKCCFADYPLGVEMMKFNGLLFKQGEQLFEGYIAHPGNYSSNA
jgi:carbamoyl-phosphate synthase large subunit